MDASTVAAAVVWPERLERSERVSLETKLLAPAATKSIDTQGRQKAENPDPLRTAFERDRDRIVHCNALRRLARKSQVFVDPDNDHFVTRLTHTLQVAQIGRAMAAALRVNEALTEAICLGHDIGHAPFGHTGEDALDEILSGGWVHADHSVRVLSVIEPLNLTFETLDGIRAHPWRVKQPPIVPEGWLCRYADRIAYLSHDVVDAIRAGIITRHDLPTCVERVLGDRHGRWVTTMVHAVIDESVRAGKITMVSEVAEAMTELREFMFERVYLSPDRQTPRAAAVSIVQNLVKYYASHPDENPLHEDGHSVMGKAVDYVAGMTDRYALRAHNELF